MDNLRSLKKAFYELISSMRFAISLLTVLAIASIIGTVLKQNEPYPNYLIQFGQFWFNAFEMLGLFDVYHTSWFIFILGFLVISTSICIYRNGPNMLREMRAYRERASEDSLKHFHHQATFHTELAQAELEERLSRYLHAQGYALRKNQQSDDKLLIAAKSGSGHRLGYLLTHTAIVIICVGGLLDGNLPLKIQQALGYKKIETRSELPQSQVPAISRLGPTNISFRGSVTIPEGSSADVVFLNVGEGYLVQDLPFAIKLKKFHIEHYTTGQPKAFASDLEIYDKAGGKPLAYTIRVNHPLIYRGVAIYQASFEDGGSRLKLSLWPLFAPDKEAFSVLGVVKEATGVTIGHQKLNIELNDFRPFNVQNFAEPGQREAAKKLQNIGPSFQFKVRDQEGQAKEYHNYMLPVHLEGRWYYLSGVRAAPNEAFQYLRLPLDGQGSLDGYMHFRAAMFNPEIRAAAARRFASQALEGAAISETLREKFTDSATTVLALFSQGGYDALARLIEQGVPKAEQEKAAETYIKLLRGAAFEVYRFTLDTRQLPIPAASDESVFLQDSLNAISDSFLYGSPFYLQLTEYEQVQASGLQLTRSPGKNIVYTGSVLLILGVFTMFYIRERRVWLLVKPARQRVLFAMSGNRKTIDFEREFTRHQENLGQLLSPTMKE